MMLFFMFFETMSMNVLFLLLIMRFSDFSLKNLQSDNYKLQHKDHHNKETRQQKLKI